MLAGSSDQRLLDVGHLALPGGVGQEVLEAVIEMLRPGPGVVSGGDVDPQEAGPGRCEGRESPQRRHEGIASRQLGGKLVGPDLLVDDHRAGECVVEPGEAAHERPQDRERTSVCGDAVHGLTAAQDDLGQGRVAPVVVPDLVSDQGAQLSGRETEGERRTDAQLAVPGPQAEPRGVVVHLHDQVRDEPDRVRPARGHGAGQALDLLPQTGLLGAGQVDAETGNHLTPRPPSVDDERGDDRRDADEGDGEADPSRESRNDQAQGSDDSTGDDCRRGERRHGEAPEQQHRGQCARGVLHHAPTGHDGSLDPWNDARKKCLVLWSLSGDPWDRIP